MIRSVIETAFLHKTGKIINIILKSSYILNIGVNNLLFRYIYVKILLKQLQVCTSFRMILNCCFRCWYPMLQLVYIFIILYVTFIYKYQISDYLGKFLHMADKRTCVFEYNTLFRFT